MKSIEDFGESNTTNVLKIDQNKPKKVKLDEIEERRKQAELAT